MKIQIEVVPLLFVQRQSVYSTEKKTKQPISGFFFFELQGFDDLIIYT